MIRSASRITTAWLAMAALSLPAYAQAPEQPEAREIVVTGKKAEKDVVTQVVSIGDLNLATDQGVQEMEKRVGSAVDYICSIPAVIGYYRQKAESPCRDEAWAGARPQMDRAVEKAKS